MMNEELKLKRKKIILSLAALLLGCLFFIFGLSLSNKLALLMNYCLALILFISAMLVVFKQYKTERQSIFLYIFILSAILIIFITFVTIINMS